MAQTQVQGGTTSVWTDKAARQFVVERVFDAPRELVWKAWTEPDRLAMWWGARQWQTTNYKMDVKPGGTWHYCMRGPDGEEAWGIAVYREIVEPERIVYVDGFSDAEGNINESMPTMVVAMEFAELGGRTKITSSAEYASEADLEAILAMGVVQGLTETWDRLAEYLAA